MKKICVIFPAILASVTAHGALNLDEPRTITAQKIEYDVKSETIKTIGETEIVNESGQRLTLGDSYITQQGDELAGEDIKMWLGNHVYIESDNIIRKGDLTIARHATFTACDDCDAYGDAWKITTYKIIHDMDTRMLKFYSPVLRTYDIPVLWLPYFEMPDPGVKYKTGLLMPDFQSTNKMGTQINIPLYISISDTHDMTFTLSYLTQENPLFQLEHRLNADHSEYRTEGSFTRNKAGENRWHIFNDDVIDLGEYARATIFLERTSDKTYLQKYGFYGDQPYLDSGAKLEVFGQSSYVVADAHIFQELRDSTGLYSAPDGDILPNIRAVHQTAPLFGETYATFGTDVLGISGDGTSAQRLIGDARLTTPWTLWGGNRLTASVSARYDVYHFNNTEMVDGDVFSGFKNRFLPSGYVEWGLPLFKPTNNWTQIIEPRARLTVMRKMDAEEFALNNDSAGTILTDSTLFSNNRFSGLDLWENGTYADYGVRWAAFNDGGHTVEVFLGQSYDFTERPAIDLNSGFHNGLSDYVGRISYNNMKWFGFASRFRLNQDDLALRHMENTINLGTAQNFFNIGHIWSQHLSDELTENTDLNEAVIGAGLKLTERWSMRWSAIYNIEVGAFQRHTGGFFYNHPCYYLSVEYRRDNAIKEDYVGTTTFQFRFGMAINGQQY
ncbi:MAG: LPS-assembly protein LptD [Alphaproteobacteria bacterium]|nr:LPS-assembly protein LptD [Alphaproteobacteria bacterium]MBQ8256075.1 LPS-assembly protein LptD [Alphaproteobacteria bacterium]